MSTCYCEYDIESDASDSEEDGAGSAKVPEQIACGPGQYDDDYLSDGESEEENSP